MDDSTLSCMARTLGLHEARHLYLQQPGCPGCPQHSCNRLARIHKLVAICFTFLSALTGLSRFLTTFLGLDRLFFRGVHIRSVTPGMRVTLARPLSLQRACRIHATHALCLCLVRSLISATQLSINSWHIVFIALFIINRSASQPITGGSYFGA